MPLGLNRYQQAQDHHFITFSCYGRLPYLADPAVKATVEQVLERTRSRHNARVYAYVLMPEYIHLLINESFNISLAMFLNPLCRKPPASSKEPAITSGSLVTTNKRPKPCQAPGTLFSSANPTQTTT